MDKQETQFIWFCLANACDSGSHKILYRQVKGRGVVGGCGKVWQNILLSILDSEHIYISIYISIYLYRL